TWSPDGRYIAFVAQRGDHEPLTLYVVRTDATAIVNLMPEEENLGFDFAFWSPDGGYIVFGLYGRNIWLAKVIIEN
ncbi:MAG: TolB family protein, partial [Calditrichia bacterium]